MDWFSSPEDPAPLQVSELSAIIEKLLDDARLQDVWVKGEVTNYTHHSRGHRYFSLSEKGGNTTTAVIRCVMWRSDADRLPFSPAEGMGVLVSGTVRTYAPHGSYQLQVKTMKQAGIGEKYLLVERWKRELAAEGCFSFERKRPLPHFPAHIGVVTSATGAVIHDIITVINRRYPIEIILSPAAVQGDYAYRDIAEAFRRLAGLADVIIIARGGGSFEDLFPFNHPDVVRAIVACPVPVVSAIGHEVDVTLADLAADLRAPTPSAAAELVVPDRNILLERMKEQRCRLSSALLSRVAYAKEEIGSLRDRLRPRQFIRRLEERKQQSADLSERLERAFLTRLERERLVLAEMHTALESRSPLAVMARGYCIAEKGNGVIKSVRQLSEGDEVYVRFFDGSSRMRVEH